VSVLSKEVVPETDLPLESVTVRETELGMTASENVTEGSVDVGLLDEPATGETLLTVGWLGGCVVSKIASTE
jgi:hypothetical protein